MIRHFVLLRFRQDVTVDVRRSLMAELGTLRDHIGGIVGFHAGENVSPEEPVIHGFRDGFWFDFVDTAARDAYLIDPRHQSVGAKLVANAEGGIEGIVVFDVEV